MHERKRDGQRNAKRGSTSAHVTHGFTCPALPRHIASPRGSQSAEAGGDLPRPRRRGARRLLQQIRSEEHTSELQSRLHLVCRLLLEKKKKIQIVTTTTLTT